MDMAIKKRHVKAIIQLRRAAESEWIERDPILRLGEPAYSSDVNKLKMGNGISHWSELEYIQSEALMIAGNGIVVDNGRISLDDLILDCGTSTTNI